MKKVLLVFLALVAASMLLGDGYPELETEDVDGVTWYFMQASEGSSYSTPTYYDESVVGYGFKSSYSGPSMLTAVSPDTVGSIVVPDYLGGRPVTGLNMGAFEGCKYLTSITLPATLKSISGSPFSGCSSLKSVVFKGDAPDIAQSQTYGSQYSDASIFFNGTSKRLIVYVPHGSIGWNGGVTTPLPESWCGRAITHIGEDYDWDGGKSTGGAVVSLNVTNTIVHYVVNSVQSRMAAPVIPSTGFVNVITEVKGGSVAVPDSWVKNYPTFASKFGSDLGMALTKKTGKKDSCGNDMFVWQDYVVGTDPTDETDRFVATITIVDGEPIVSYSPELSEEEKAKRKYTILGKTKLTDADWTEIDGNTANYNFFKVTVEMKR